MNGIEFHEAANIFPLDEEHIDTLAEDIRARGLLVAIELLGGKIIDGRRRHLACEKAGIKAQFRDVQSDDPVAYVLSLNLHRRQLTPSQAAMVAARAREWYDLQAKERMAAGQKAGGRGHVKNSGANLPQSNDAGRARDQAAKAVGVSGKTVDYATRVLKSAIPDVVKAVDEGRMAVSTAAILAAEPEEVQQREVDNPKRRRSYESLVNGGQTVGRNSGPEAEPDPDNNPEDRKILGKGITLAHEAINCLKRIPKNDALRKRGFQLVTDWIRHNP